MTREQADANFLRSRIAEKNLVLLSSVLTTVVLLGGCSSTKCDGGDFGDSEATSAPEDMEEPASDFTDETEGESGESKSGTEEGEALEGVFEANDRTLIA